MPHSPTTIDDLIAAAKARLFRGERNPASTYRLQFHAWFTFGDAVKIISYLHALGVTHVYASPILKARAGSMHGYDVVDHNALNPELGSAEDFEAFVAALRAHDMKQVVDIVPNHMGVGTNENVWWNDCLENGSGSRFAEYFDIAWQDPGQPQMNGKVLLPVLGDPYGHVLEEGKLGLTLAEGALFVTYYDRRFPIAPSTYGGILYHRIEDLRTSLGTGNADLMAYENLAERDAIDAPLAERDQSHASLSDGPRLKRGLADILVRNKVIRAFVLENITIFNGQAGDPSSFDLLDKFLGRQFYKIAWWRTAPDEINYRRFFDINDLAALRMDRREVFDDAHRLIFQLLAEEKIAGLRIDHPDGLLDPDQYFHRLQMGYAMAVAKCLRETDPRFKDLPWEKADVEHVAASLAGALPSWRDEQPPAAPTAASPDEETPGQWPLYVVAEKILATDEPLPREWAVHGTTGYNFVNQANGMFVDGDSAGAFTRHYRDWIADDVEFSRLCIEKKRSVLQKAFGSELTALAGQVHRLAEKSRGWRDFTLARIHALLREVIAGFPVYRTYIVDAEFSEYDRGVVEGALSATAERNRDIDPRLFTFLADLLLLRYPPAFDEALRREQRECVGKFQQLCAPVTAKGIEDTAFYIFSRLVSLNEVGGDPSRFGVPPAALHQWMLERQTAWPLAMSPLTTHDTKRSEDFRARVNVLSEFPEEWWQRVARWSRLNQPLRPRVDGALSPDANDEYLLYQTLLGMWPLEAEGQGLPSTDIQRVQQYMQKALREAKVHTNWIQPNSAYESATADFIAAIVSREKAPLFLQDFSAFQRRVSHYGLLNSLSQTVLRLIAPGVPDTYQGTELWDFSMVDPDNRRAVDYVLREQLLRDIVAGDGAAGNGRIEFARELMASRKDGRLKLFLTWKCLQLRKKMAALFAGGEYWPIEAEGKWRGNVFAFARRLGNRTVVTAIPRLTSRLGSVNDLPVGEGIWGDTHLLLPAALTATRFENIFTGEIAIAAGQGEGRRRLDLSNLFRHITAAVLVAE